jgi:hypothetical protein
LLLLLLLLLCFVVLSGALQLGGMRARIPSAIRRYDGAGAAPARRLPGMGLCRRGGAPGESPGMGLSDEGLGPAILYGAGHPRVLNGLGIPVVHMAIGHVV